jgi:hypothetical protein
MLTFFSSFLFLDISDISDISDTCDFLSLNSILLSAADLSIFLSSGMAGEQHGHGMGELTWCGMAGAHHGMAWARHGVCELSLKFVCVQTMKHTGE